VTFNNKNLSQRLEKAQNLRLTRQRVQSLKKDIVSYGFTFEAGLELSSFYIQLGKIKTGKVILDDIFENFKDHYKQIQFYKREYESFISLPKVVSPRTIKNFINDLYLFDEVACHLQHKNFEQALYRLSQFSLLALRNPYRIGLEMITNIDSQFDHSYSQGSEKVWQNFFISKVKTNLENFVMRLGGIESLSQYPSVSFVELIDLIYQCYIDPPINFREKNFEFNNQQKTTMNLLILQATFLVALSKTIKDESPIAAIRELVDQRNLDDLADLWSENGTIESLYDLPRYYDEKAEKLKTAKRKGF